eukprot:6974927-Prymnesium_polylepis.1
MWALAAVATHHSLIIHERRSAAKVVKARTGGRSSTTASCSRLHASPTAPAKPKAMKAAAPAAKATGGKARKAGMMLARAKLGTATSELAATRDRQAALPALEGRRQVSRRRAHCMRGAYWHAECGDHAETERRGLGCCAQGGDEGVDEADLLPRFKTLGTS